MATIRDWTDDQADEIPVTIVAMTSGWQTQTVAYRVIGRRAPSYGYLPPLSRAGDLTLRMERGTDLTAAQQLLWTGRPIRVDSDGAAGFPPGLEGGWCVVVADGPVTMDPSSPDPSGPVTIRIPYTLVTRDGLEAE